MRRQKHNQHTETHTVCSHTHLHPRPTHTHTVCSHAQTPPLFAPIQTVCSLVCTQLHPHSHPYTNTADQTHSAQNIQVDRRGLGQILEQAVDLFDVQSHVGFSLPAAQHQVVHLLWTGTRPLQHAPLGDTLDHLHKVSPPQCNWNSVQFNYLFPQGQLRKPLLTW